MSALLLIAGFVLLVVGAEALVRGASRLAGAAGISPLVVGLTVVAYGTSAPELMVSTVSALAGQPDIALGNVVGSNIFNVLFILGVSALISPLLVSQQLVRLDVPIMIVASSLVLALGLDGRIGRIEGAFLLAGAIAYTVFLIVQSRRERQAIVDQYAQEFGPSENAPAPRWPVSVGLLLLGLALLVIGARWLVEGAIDIARQLGVSELIVGLTIVAAGTSLPEVATSVVASLRGERDIAVGNVIGSNIFNVLAVLGATSAISPEGVAVSRAALGFDIPVMIAVALACLPIFFTGYVISRWEGALFLGYYVAYTLYLLLSSAQHALLPLYSLAMMAFVIPLTVITLAVITFRAVRARRTVPSAGED